MLRRARELMERGHVSGARLIFEHLATRQSALGAFALAQTYDEKFLKTLRVKGSEPDQKLAAKWYRRAAELGTQSAAGGAAGQSLSGRDDTSRTTRDVPLNRGRCNPATVGRVGERPYDLRSGRFAR